MSALTQDAFFTQVFESGLSNASSKLYLPGMIMATSNPSLNPYTIDSTDLGKQDFGMGITVDVKLQNLAIAGIPNISVAPGAGGNFVLTGLTTNFLAQFCTLNPPPSGVSSTLSITSRFTLSNPDAGSISGSFSVTISAAALGGQFVVSGADFTTIVITFRSLSASVPATVTVNPQITFDGGGGGFWANLFQKYLQKQSTIQSIVQQINAQVQGVMDQISTEITQIVRENLKKQVGG